MRRVAIGFVILALLAVAIWLFRPGLDSPGRRTNPYITTMEVSGTPGASFGGEYVRDGKRVTFTGVLPWSLSESNVSRLEIRKANPGDSLTVDVRGGGSRVSVHANPGALGVRLEMDGGWSAETLR